MKKPHLLFVHLSLLVLSLGLGLTPAAFSAEQVLPSAVEGAPRVAVLMEPGFPRHGSPLDLPAPVILRLLAREGITAVALSAADLANPQSFNAQRFSLLVISSGNCYPKAALANLHAFRAAGGGMVTSGFSFYTAYENVNSEWVSKSREVAAFGHSPEGVGTGSFSTLKPGSNPPMSVVPANVLDFKCEKPLGERERITWLNRSSLAAEDEVLPLLTIRDPEGVEHPAAALVRHKCKPFQGACDLWLGNFQLYYDITDRNVVEQIFCRGVLWCLKEKGLLDAGRFAEQLRKLDERKPIAELPGKLVYAEDRRPWGKSFLPKSAAPARKLLVVNTCKLSEAERIAITCLQGLVAREQPRLWLVRSAREKQDRYWLEQHKRDGYIDDSSEVADWPALFQQFKSAYRGAVVADPSIYRGELLALNVAMCEDLILATPELAERLNLPIKVDLRGRFTTYAEGMRWIWKTYQNKFNRFVCDFLYPKRLANCVFDYDLQWRAPVFWIAGSRDAYEPGVDASEEFSVIGAMLAQMAPQSAVLGFPAQGDLGAGEPVGVQLVSRYGRGLVCTDSLANMSVTSGVRLDTLSQRRGPTPALDRKNIYVAMVMSDGDNLNCWEAGFYHRYFESPAFGCVPVAFTMGPELRELTPVVARWFYDHAASNTEFISGVAGISYTAPKYFGKAFTQPSAAENDFLKWTSWAMQDMGMRSLNITPGCRDSMESFSRGLPFCHSLLYGWTREHGAKLESLTYTLASGMPAFDSAMIPRPPEQSKQMKTDHLAPAKNLVADFAAMGNIRRPLFLCMTVENWSYDMKNLEYVAKNAPADVVFVTPTQLSELYLQAREKPVEVNNAGQTEPK